MLKQHPEFIQIFKDALFWKIILKYFLQKQVKEIWNFYNNYTHPPSPWKVISRSSAIIFNTAGPLQ